MWCELGKLYRILSPEDTKQHMGLYCVELKDQAIAEIRSTMEVNGLPVLRVEERINGTYYFYRDPKSKREVAFWITSRDGKSFWCCGLSAGAKSVAECFPTAGLFANWK
jgi:hypothetical protein